jgi:hypothetical protein
MEKTPDFAEYFYYDETSPTCLRWKVSVFRGRKDGRGGGGNPVVMAGDLAGSLVHKYNKVKLDGKMYQVSRVIYKLLNPPAEMDGKFIDHINGDSKDNRIVNLRLVSRVTNNRNKKKSLNNTSGVTGVYFYYHKKKKWTSAFAVVVDDKGKRITKSFSTKLLGLLPAFAKAVQWRIAKLAEVNKLGAGYTNRHINN